MNDLRRAWLITLKDLRIEFRTGGRLLSMIAFVVLAGFLFAFALNHSQVAGRDVAAALIWLIILFASTAGAGRIFDAEEEEGAFRHLLLTPVSRPSVFLGKTAANLAVIWLVTALTFISLTAFLDVRDAGSLAAHTAVFLPGTIGLAATGTFFGRMSRHSNLGDSLLPVLTFPLLVPVIYFGATSTARVFLERPWTEISGSVRLLWAFAVGSVFIGAALFRHITDE